MRFREWDDYLNSMLKHVKFTPDRKKIRQEFGEHMEDMFDDYISDGMSEEDAKNSVLENIGDAEDIGKMMNKAHNALIGWIWAGVKVLLVVTIIISLSPVLDLVQQTGLGIMNMIHGYHENDYYGDEVYKVDIDQTVEIDGHRLVFDDLKKYENGTFVLRYRDFRNPFSSSGGYCFDNSETLVYSDNDSMMSPVFVKDLGNAGFVNYFQVAIAGFDEDVSSIFIEYNGNRNLYKGRHFLIEVDLPDR